MILSVDLGHCTDCGSCVEVCPEVFKKNSETGYIEIFFLDKHPENCVKEAISICPADCIAWEESNINP